MPARDKFHHVVKAGLQNEGWVITADPLYLEFGGVDLYVDLAADKIIAAEKEGCRIAVEIKSFTAPSLISEFHTALGQFINYRTTLQVQEPERQLYLAVPEDTYNAFFMLPFTQMVVSQQQIKLIVYNVDQDFYKLWIDIDKYSCIGHYYMSPRLRRSVKANPRKRTWELKVTRLCSPGCS